MKRKASKKELKEQWQKIITKMKELENLKIEVKE